ncbi:MAG: metal-dependent hydrolase [Spirochaetota bacterium]
MTAATHYAFSYLVATTAGISPGVALVTSMAALIPDIDHPESMAGRLCPSLSRRIMQKYGHRTITHSLFAILAVSIVLSPLIILSFFSPFSKIGFVAIYFSLLLAYSSHIFIDLFNRAGVKLLAPVTQKEYISFRTPALRILVRSWQEYLLLFCIVFLAFTVSGEAFSMSKAVRSASKLFYRNYDGALSDYEHNSKSLCTAKIEYFDAVQSNVMKESFVVLTMFPENVYLLRYDPAEGIRKAHAITDNRIILKKDIINGGL